MNLYLGGLVPEPLSIMATSRIFVKGLPTSLTEAEFRKHFSAGNREVTDVKLMAQRRIGYVGYKSPEDAAKAVKYFNKTYIRMSKIAVEPAKAVSLQELPEARGNALVLTGMQDLRSCLDQGKFRHPNRRTGEGQHRVTVDGRF